ncbi:MAG: hypothetical protein U0R65_12465 [Candidatus Nanopelagicales bacterium]
MKENSEKSLLRNSMNASPPGRSVAMFLSTWVSLRTCGMTPIAIERVVLAVAQQLDVGRRVLDVAPDDPVGILADLRHALAALGDHRLADVEARHLHAGTGERRERGSSPTPTSTTRSTSFSMKEFRAAAAGKKLAG